MLSFVVPAYNEERCLPATLAAIHAAMGPIGAPYEIVVANDASTDATVALAEAGGARVVTVENRQIAKTRQVRETRDNERCRTTLEALRKAAASGNVNMMPFVLDCVRSYATLGEICDTLREIYGIYEEPAF